MLRIALPNKGRLLGDIRVTLADAGYEIRSRSDRALIAALGDEHRALFVRAADIPEIVADGAADAGITGHDQIRESGLELEERLDLEFGRCRLVVAARPNGAGEIPSLAALDGARIATAFPRLTRSFFDDNGVTTTIVPVSGAAEAAPHLGIADAICDLTETGSTLAINGLREIATVLVSSARFVTRPAASLTPENARDLERVIAALESVVLARTRRYLMANLPRTALQAARALLPGLRGPTVVEVDDTEGRFVAVHAVVAAATMGRTLHDLKAIGAEGILVTRMERLTP